MNTLKNKNRCKYLFLERELVFSSTEIYTELNYLIENASISQKCRI